MRQRRPSPFSSSSSSRSHRFLGLTVQALVKDPRRCRDAQHLRGAEPAFQLEAVLQERRGVVCQLRPRAVHEGGSEKLEAPATLHDL